MLYFYFLSAFLLFGCQMQNEIIPPNEFNLNLHQTNFRDLRALLCSETKNSFVTYLQIKTKRCHFQGMCLATLPNRKYIYLKEEYVYIKLGWWILEAIRRYWQVFPVEKVVFGAWSNDVFWCIHKLTTAWWSEVYITYFCHFLKEFAYSTAYSSKESGKLSRIW